MPNNPSTFVTNPPTDDADFAGFRAGFPAFDQRIYLNLAARGLISRSTRNAVASALDDQMYGRIDKAAWKQVATSARRRFATLCHVEAQDIGITKNVSDGLNAIALALPWVSGDNMLFSPDFEHPNGVYCFVHLQSRGVAVRSVATAGHTIDVDAMISAMDTRTRLVAVSAVGFASGVRADLARLGQACAERDILLLVDAAQSIGVIDLDLNALGVGALAASTNKGLLGLYGQGFVYCSPRWADRLVPAQLSRFGIDAGDLPESEMGPPDYRLRAGAGRFELGNPNWPALIASNASMGELLALGSTRIEAHALAIAQRLASGLNALGLNVIRPPRAALQSHITLVAPRDAADRSRLDAIGTALMRADVQHSVRRGALRFATHAYNTPADADRVIEIAGDVVRAGH